MEEMDIGCHVRRDFTKISLGSNACVARFDLYVVIGHRGARSID